jgi:anti-anti-sigma factor
VTGAEVLEVRLLRLPVALRHRASEHHAALRREFALIVSSGAGGASVPSRLLSLSEQLSERLSNLGEGAFEQMEDAYAAGKDEIDLVLHVPAEVAPALREFDRLLDEADAHCRSGEHLLTLAEPDDVGRFRRWFLNEIADQLDGRPPVAWPDHRPVVRHALPAEIDLDAAPALRQELNDVLHEAGGHIALDGAGVEFIDSVGISLLMATYIRADAAGGRLWIESASPMLRRVLESASLADLLLDPDRDSGDEPPST